MKRMSRRELICLASTVGILGVTFKDNCPDIRNSKVFDLISELQSRGVSALIHDLWADPEEVRDEHDFVLLPSIDACSCDAVVVAVAHQQFVEKFPSELMVCAKIRKKLCSGT